MAFEASIVSITSKILFDGEVHSVMLPGVEGEFEVVQLHGPIAALLAPGRVVALEEKKILWEGVIEQGVMRFDGKKLFAVVE